MYIVIEGQDATGKSTQVELLADYFRSKNQKVVTLHEPDGDLASTHSLRDLIKNKDYDLEPTSHVLLFTAARIELWQKIAAPALAQGAVVISSRNWWSTLAYQGYGQGVPLEQIEKITKTFIPETYLTPEKAAILTLDDENRLARQSSRDQTAITNAKKDTFESKPVAFQHKVDAAYLEIAKSYNLPTLDASPDPNSLHEQLKALLF